MISDWQLIGWFFTLILQSAAFSWVSRARNSGSYGYHAIASVFSNGIFFITNLFLISQVAKPDMQAHHLITLGVVYVLGSVLGSVGMHWVSINYLEKGKRKVGAQ
jgi:hypothetical protein